MKKHDHSTEPNYKRIHASRDSFTVYQPGVRGCKECEQAANAKNIALQSAAHNAFLKKNRLA